MVSDTTPRKGQWANAPLVFVLAQVRFLPNAAAAPEHLRDAIVKRIGAHFPTISQTTGVSIEINLDAAPSLPRATHEVAYDLVNNDVDAMVRVQQGALTYAVTSYVDSSHFREAWLDITNALDDVQVSTVTRLGLRYVDFLVPQHGRRPEDYVNAPWNLNEMPKLPGAMRGPDLHVSMVDVAYPAGRMRLQFMRGFGVPSLPMDLQGMLSPRQQSAPAPGECGVIDSDRWVDGEHRADRATLSQLFTQMHTDVSSAFRAMITPLARCEWGPEAARGDNA
ncbi:MULTISPECIES: TIGR04255 family protein [Ralstonia]|uniref:TIGR04255 family protein n=4 Tax=Pseudomonadota TaxID=1224 RepID=R0E6W0_RALPI|nr:MULTISPECIES: TIGR04255 family protein [Ralstonia]ENZ77879.1 hypothetical protein OR214_02155 [Ralstonia pickettii OR214]MBL4777837.1 TIGR04255 family protein [Ralstonia sp.]MCM3582024.1 TIGR04255 family protein [Ralstonia pickettii]